MDIPKDLIGVIKEYLSVAEQVNLDRYQGVKHLAKYRDYSDYCAEKGFLDDLKWATKNGFMCTACTYSCAVAGGNVNILIWLKSHNYPINKWVFSTAASYGNIEILEWLKKNKCPWDSRLYSFAKNEEVINWLRKNNCPEKIFDDDDKELPN